MSLLKKANISEGSGCIPGTIRLVGGQSESEGAVQMCVNGVWGHVCSHNWHSSNARVVCRQLGYSTTCKQCVVVLCSDNVIISFVNFSVWVQPQSVQWWFFTTNNIWSHILYW